MATQLTFGQPYRRSNNGNFKLSATIPKEQREVCFGRGSTKRLLSLVPSQFVKGSHVFGEFHFWLICIITRITKDINFNYT